MKSMNSTFVKPCYDAHGFANLPAFITSLLGGPKAKSPFQGLAETYDNVVLFFIDGFGWRFTERFGDEAFLQRFHRDGQVAKLTSLFPSTTSAHVPFIHSGQPMGESGLHEWNYYEPLLDAMIVPLLFSFTGTAERDQLKATGINPKSLYPPRSIYRRLKGLGVKSQVFQHREYTPSTYSNIAFDGANTRGFKTLPESMVNIRQALSEAKGKNYTFFYYDKIDSINHEYGPDSPQADAEIDAFLTIVERNFFGKAQKSAGKTLLLLTADHGQSEVDPKTTVYLNRAFPGFEKFIKTTAGGQLLVPGGSCRDMFLYIKDELLDEAQALLTEGLAGKADVVRTSDLIEAGYFGPQVTPRLRERMGNLVILSYRYESVWWYEKGKFEQKYYGHHGGLTPQEMEIPLLALEI
ncbi:MAG: phosphodiesterase [Chloroflexi bacterium HGW-Chloroflexi-6]|nr:MAG: phosphodiesterase [Chloroflexi bacterium HGW-Chloroflexi-6]